jgi:hypothetical protein
VIGFFGALLLLACLACGWAWSEMVPNALVRTLERKPDPEALLQQIKTTLRRLPDLYGLLITLPVVEAVDAPLASQSQWVKNGLIGGGATSVWGQGSYLVLPVMAIEARSLHESLVRTAQLVRENRPQVDPGVVGARLAAVLVGLVIAVIGFGASLWIYRAMGSHLIDMGVAVVLYGLFVSAAGSLATGAINVYETCLYLWAVAAEREENSRSGDNSIPAAPPAPLAAVLTGMASIPAPYFSE